MSCPRQARDTASVTVPTASCAAKPPNPSTRASGDEGTLRLRRPAVVGNVDGGALGSSALPSRLCAEAS